MLFIDLFAGLGGFNLALSELGHKCVFASEIDETLRSCYRINFGLEPVGDIRNISADKVPSHQILCAGFPCQPFSKAGSQLGLNDRERGNLFYEILKIIDHHKPQYLLLENVPNITRHDHGRTWKKIRQLLEDRGYYLKCRELSPHHFGIPQIRPRTYILASKSTLDGFVWPEPSLSENISVKAILDTNPPQAQKISFIMEDCLDIWQEFLDLAPKEEKLPHPLWSMEFGATYPYEDTTPYALPYEELVKYRGSFGQPLTGRSKSQIMEQLPSHATRKETHFPNWKIKMIAKNRSFYQNNVDWIDEWKKKIQVLPTSFQKLEWNCQGDERLIRKYIIQFRASGVRVKRLGWAPSLVANTTQVPVIGWESRFMTVDECKRLQCMDELCLPGSKEKSYEALGNAVNVQVVKKIADALLKSDKCEMIQVSEKSLTINVRPPVSVYATYQRLSYKPWYAISEFVDNSTQSYFENRESLQKAFKNNGNGRLNISISYDSEKNILEITDNANGMDISELTRAVVLNRKPPITDGRSEFGMGLKTAACWFGRRWSIETKKIGLKEKYHVEIDVRDLMENKTEDIPITVKPANLSEHYTIVRIEDLYKPIRTSTHGRIRDQLSSIYRQDLRSGEIGILWNGVELQFNDPLLLVEEQEDGGSITWRKDFRINVPWETCKSELMAYGWVGIRSKGSQRDAGFALMRRGRVIVGGPDAGYKPTEIFGQPNSFRSQRLVGEINMDSWPVSHSKDMFDWSGGLEEDFIGQLKTVCKEYMYKAEGYRSPKKPPTDQEMKEAAETAKKVFGSKKFGKAISTELRFPPPKRPPEQEKSDLEKIQSVSKGPISFVMPMMNDQWIFNLHWQNMLSESRWMTVDFPQDNQAEIYLNSAHPFFLEYMENRSMLELIQKFVISLALAEKLARQTSSNNMIDPADLRNYMNRVLLYASHIREDSA